MPDHSLFDKHLKTGFQPGWEQDLPAFEPHDWQQLIVLACKIDELCILYGNIYTSERGFTSRADYDAMRKTIAPEFWRAVGADIERNTRVISDELRRATIRLARPFGTSLVGSERSTLIDGLKSYIAVITDEQVSRAKIVKSFSDGLRHAVLDLANPDYVPAILRDLMDLAHSLSHARGIVLLGTSDLRKIEQFIKKTPLRPGPRRTLQEWLDVLTA